MAGLRYVVAGALVALVLLVVPIGLVPFVVPPMRAEAPAGPSRLPDGNPALAASMSCSDTAEAVDEVPDDVVAARLCATDNGLVRWYAPQDGLHADLAPLVELLGTLGPVPPSTSGRRYVCPQDGGWAFDLRLALASGETVSIPGDTGGCSTVRIAGEDVVGADEVLAAFLDALTVQRRVSEPATDLADLPLSCGSDTTFGDHVASLVGDPREIVRAVSCTRPTGGDDVAPWGRPVALRAADLALLLDGPCAGRSAVDRDLVGQTRWGDVVVVRDVCAAVGGRA